MVNQQAVTQSTSKVIVVAGGRRSGKTFAASLRATESLKEGRDVFYICKYPATYLAHVYSIVKELLPEASLKTRDRVIRYKGSSIWFATKYLDGFDHKKT